MNGKGDKRRPTNEKVFRKNYDIINWRSNKPNNEVNISNMGRNEFVIPQAEGCHYCGHRIVPKVVERRVSDGTTTGSIITECRWICPKCGMLSRQGIVRPEYLKKQ